MPNEIIFTVFIIFFGAAIFATVALYTRQSLLVCYILLGLLIGPPGFALITETDMIQKVGDIGIIFLLFLLGLHLQPQKLLHMLKKVSWVALLSSLAFFGIGFMVPFAFGYGLVASTIVGASVMFSSTIIALKLLPTTILHHQHTGELMISVLLMQDLLAIIVLLILTGAHEGNLQWSTFALTALTLPGLLLAAFLVEYFILSKLFVKFDRIREYLFLLSIAWCLGMSELADWLINSPEIGAFIGGVAIATSPIAVYIAESLKPLRDFFLVMFFVATGASLDPQYLTQTDVIVPALILAGLLIVTKPAVLGYLLRQVSETKRVAWEVGCRLGQASEFSILVAYLAATSNIPGLGGDGDKVLNLVQITTILTFIVSSYWVVMRYPTPMSLVDRLRRD